MLKIARLQPDDIEAARALACDNYRAAQIATPDLPGDGEIPELRWFLAEEGGVAFAAWENGALVGYLGFYAPFDGLFGPVLGTFSPLHGHAAIEPNRAAIYSRLYQAAAAELVARNATSHAVVLHASDTAGVHSFFTNGFGLRTVDAVRRVEPIEAATTIDLRGLLLEELAPAERVATLAHHNALALHMSQSPSFMPAEYYSGGDLLASFERHQSRLFVARDGKQSEARIIASMELREHGENFITVASSYRHLGTSYMDPEYRGRGIYTALLNFLLATLEGEGYTHLGVDFESFNPTARGFWLKHFKATTYGVTRRIDERILNREP